MRNVTVEVIIRVKQDRSYLESEALSESHISSKADYALEELSSVVADRVREAKVLADERLSRFAREELSRIQREAEQKAEREHTAAS